ncbi:RNA methyltransferase [Cyanobacterium stanieri LEGE 03274]|uniref:tRNA (cytidine/uridine-2'-O-)-methyltransferase TrmJ n=1 Tax=Cyanobacterium stanieri LEGE 03274 TaxID=1828756 RepID=A0ABR9V8T8_9CHRO|nr:RNA methyltransferase [Cyanobacterium stanieri]MBE9223264.1 RNA methyltransferase [Cyanobacterium stanieri LEGE 03274]
MAFGDEVKIVLVETAGERNIGSIARVMKNMGLGSLVLVNPRCDHLSEDATIMAVHATEILKGALVVDTLPEALKDCQRAIATTARPRGIPTKLETPREALPWLVEKNTSSALIFGPEDRGLSNQELSYAQRFICIPSNPEYPSLNLAQAVGVCAYELYQYYHSQTIEPESEELTPELASLEALEGYYQHLESVLLKINYLYPHTAPTKMEKFRRLINRSKLQPQEVAMLRGILRQAEWAIAHKPEQE